MAANQNALLNYIGTILTPAQKVMIADWSITGTATPAPAAVAKLRARKTTRMATRSTNRAATATRTAKTSPTVQTLIDFYAVNPGGHSEAALAALPGIAPNILGRVLKAKSSPFRKSGDLWVMRGGATVSRKLTQPLAEVPRTGTHG